MDTSWQSGLTYASSTNKCNDSKIEGILDHRGTNKPNVSTLGYDKSARQNPTRCQQPYPAAHVQPGDIEQYQYQQQPFSSAAECPKQVTQENMCHQVNQIPQKERIKCFARSTELMNGQRIGEISCHTTGCVGQKVALARPPTASAQADEQTTHRETTLSDAGREARVKCSKPAAACKLPTPKCNKKLAHHLPPSKYHSGASKVGRKSWTNERYAKRRRANCKDHCSADTLKTETNEVRQTCPPKKETGCLYAMTEKGRQEPKMISIQECFPAGILGRPPAAISTTPGSNAEDIFPNKHRLEKCFAAQEKNISTIKKNTDVISKIKAETCRKETATQHEHFDIEDEPPSSFYNYEAILKEQSKCSATHASRHLTTALETTKADDKQVLKLEPPAIFFSPWSNMSNSANKSINGKTRDMAIGIVPVRSHECLNSKGSFISERFHSCALSAMRQSCQREQFIRRYRLTAQNKLETAMKKSQNFELALTDPKLDVEAKSSISQALECTKERIENLKTKIADCHQLEAQAKGTRQSLSVQLRKAESVDVETVLSTLTPDGIDLVCGQEDEELFTPTLPTDRNNSEKRKSSLTLNVETAVSSNQAAYRSRTLTPTEIFLTSHRDSSISDTCKSLLNDAEDMRWAEIKALFSESLIRTNRILAQEKLQQEIQIKESLQTELNAIKDRCASGAECISLWDQHSEKIIACSDKIAALQSELHIKISQEAMAKEARRLVQDELLTQYKTSLQCNLEKETMSDVDETSVLKLLELTRVNQFSKEHQPERTPDKVSSFNTKDQVLNAQTGVESSLKQSSASDANQKNVSFSSNQTPQTLPNSPIKDNLNSWKENSYVDFKLSKDEGLKDTDDKTSAIAIAKQESKNVADKNEKIQTAGMAMIADAQAFTQNQSLHHKRQLEYVTYSDMPKFNANSDTGLAKKSRKQSNQEIYHSALAMDKNQTKILNTHHSDANKKPLPIEASSKNEYKLAQEELTLVKHNTESTEVGKNVKFVDARQDFHQQESNKGLVIYEIKTPLTVNKHLQPNAAHSVVATPAEISTVKIDEVSTDVSLQKNYVVKPQEIMSPATHDDSSQTSNRVIVSKTEAKPPAWQNSDPVADNDSYPGLIIEEVTDDDDPANSAVAERKALTDGSELIQSDEVKKKQPLAAISNNAEVTEEKNDANAESVGQGAIVNYHSVSDTYSPDAAKNQEGLPLAETDFVSLKSAGSSYHSVESQLTRTSISGNYETATESVSTEEPDKERRKKKDKRDKQSNGKITSFESNTQSLSTNDLKQL